MVRAQNRTRALRWEAGALTTAPAQHPNRPENSKRERKLSNLSQRPGPYETEPFHQ